ncbi:unnamed protein product [Amaranthus hypochondriacus]
MEEAQRAINAADTEVESVENGIKLVKLMGRDNEDGTCRLFDIRTGHQLRVYDQPNSENEVHPVKSIAFFILRRLFFAGCNCCCFFFLLSCCFSDDVRVVVLFLLLCRDWLVVRAVSVVVVPVALSRLARGEGCFSDLLVVFELLPAELFLFCYGLLLLLLL